MGAAISVADVRFGKSIPTEKKVSYLQRTPFFCYLKKETIHEFARCFSSTLKSRQGRMINLNSNRIYIVAEGEVVLSTSYPKRRTKIEARGYLCRKRQGDIVNVHQTKQDIQRRMTIDSKKLKELSGDVMVTSCGETDTLLLCADMDALSAFTKSHPDLSSPIESIINSQIEDKLLTIPFLQEIPRSKLAVFAAMCRYEAFDAGVTIFDENSRADKLYLVLAGVAKVIVIANRLSSSSSAVTGKSVALQRSLECSVDRLSMVESNEVLLASLKSGDYFGETALVFNIDRTCSVKTAEKCLFLTVHKKDFENFLKIYPLEDTFKTGIKQRMVSKLSSLGIPFLRGIPEEMFSSLSYSSSIIEVPKDHVIFREGDMGDLFYIIVHGSVKVTAKIDSRFNQNVNDEIIDGNRSGNIGSSESANEIDLGTLGSGQYFGEMALVNTEHCFRTATVTSSQKTILLSIDKVGFQNLLCSNKDLLAEFELRVLKTSAQLSHILAYSKGVSFFHKFLQSEHAGENIEFLVAAKKFADAMNDSSGKEMRNEERQAAAKLIFETFCAPNSQQQINLPHKLQLELDRSINQIDIKSDLFEAATQEIYSLMEKDKFLRFKASDEFKALLNYILPP